VEAKIFRRTHFLSFTLHPKWSTQESTS
jgi:hypothetical protein